MTAASSAGASADATRRCPGCPNRVPLTEPWCEHCWARLPQGLSQPVQVAFRRNETNAYYAAVHEARQWLKANPPAATLAEQMQDMANMLAGVGRHAGHSRRQDGAATVCSCGVAVTRSRP